MQELHYTGKKKQLPQLEVYNYIRNNICKYGNTTITGRQFIKLTIHTICTHRLYEVSFLHFLNNLCHS